MNKPGGSAGWVATLTPAQKERVYDALEARGIDVERQRTGHKHGGNLTGWWLWLDRSVNTPRAIVLRHRDSGGRVTVEIPIDATP